MAKKNVIYDAQELYDQETLEAKQRAAEQATQEQMQRRMEQTKEEKEYVQRRAQQMSKELTFNTLFLSQWELTQSVYEFSCEGWSSDQYRECEYDYESVITEREQLDQEKLNLVQECLCVWIETLTDQFVAEIKNSGLDKIGSIQFHSDKLIQLMKDASLIQEEIDKRSSTPPSMNSRLYKNF